MLCSTSTGFLEQTKQPGRREKTHLVLIGEVPNANNIAVNNLYTVFQGVSSEVVGNPEVSPVSFRSERPCWVELNYRWGDISLTASPNPMARY